MLHEPRVLFEPKWHEQTLLEVQILSRGNAILVQILDNATVQYVDSQGIINDKKTSKFVTR